MRYSLWLDPRILTRLKWYVIEVSRGRATSMSGVVESAVIEYLERRADRAGKPRPNTSPAPHLAWTRRGRPSDAETAARVVPVLDKATGRPLLLDMNDSEDGP